MLSVAIGRLLCIRFVLASPGDTSTVIPAGLSLPESAVPALGGYLVSEMGQLVNYAVVADSGTIKKFNTDGTLDNSFAAITGLAENKGLAITSAESKLFVAVNGAVLEYDLTSASATLSRTLDVSEHTNLTNGLCLSNDEQFLYVTEPGWTLSPMTGQVTQKSSPPILLAITLGTGDIQSLLPQSPAHSPNGCVVHSSDSSVVYMVNAQHGVTAWNKDSGNVPVTWGANIKALQESIPMIGDGIVHHGGIFYLSNIGVDGMAQTGNIYSCDPTADPAADCTVFAEQVGADLQLDLRNESGPILLAPHLMFGLVSGIELPVIESTDSTDSGSADVSAGRSAFESLSVLMQVLFAVVTLCWWF